MGFWAEGHGFWKEVLVSFVWCAGRVLPEEEPQVVQDVKNPFIVDDEMGIVCAS